MTGSLIGALRVTLGLDTAAFDDGLNRAGQKLSGFGDHVKGTGVAAALDEIFDRSRLKLLDTGVEKVGLFGSAFEKLGVAGIAAGVGIGATAVAFEGLSKSLEFADKLGKLAQSVGVPVEELSKLKYAADLSDVSLESLGGGLTKLTGNMSKVAEGAKGPAAEAFRALGIQVKGADGTLRPASDVMLQIAGRFAGMKDGATKTALAVAIFGKSGNDLIPLLNQGRDGLAAMGTEAEKLGLVITEQTAKGAEEFNDNMKRLGAVVQGVGVQIASDLAPALGGITGALVDAAKNTQLMHTVGELLAGTLKLIASGAIVATAGLVDVYEAGKAAIEVSNDLLHGDFRAAQRDNKAAGQAMYDATTGAFDLLKKVWSPPEASSAEAAGAGKTNGPVLSDPNAAARAAAQKTASDQAIAQAAKAELAARIALTGDINELAALKTQQVDQETRDANQHLRDEANAKKISQAAANEAIALNTRAAAEKKLLIERQRQADLAKAAVEQEAQLGGYAQQVAQAQAALATSAAARAKIEEAALVAQQKIDRDKLKRELDAEVAAGTKTRAEADAVIAAQAEAQAAERLVKTVQDQDAIQKEKLARAEAALNLQIELDQAEGSLKETVIGQRDAALRLLAHQKELERLKLEEIIASKTANDAAKAEAQARLDQLDKIYGAQAEVIKRQHTLADQFHQAANAVKDMASAFRDHDWVTLFQEVADAIKHLEEVLGDVSASFADKVSAVAGLASGIGQVIGGKAGKALSNAAQFAAIGAQLGGPVGAVIGAVVGGLSSLIGGKPSNYTATAQLKGDTYSLGGDKPNTETSSAAQQVAQAIVQGQDALRQLGATLGATVTNLAIGQRDASKITLSDGRVVSAGAGNPQAAAEAALKAVLAGATFVDQAEQKMVNSMVAAGDGFDQITAALQGYQQAAAIPQQIADQILQLTDPQSYDKKQVTDAIQAQRAAAQQAADAGYLTADQLSAVNAQLDNLQKLQLDQVMAKYASAVTAASQAQADAQAALAAAADQAKSTLKDAFDAQVTALNDTISTYKTLSTSLHGFADNLKQAANPQTTLAHAQAAFDALAGQRDAASLGALPAAAQALVDAVSAGAHSQLEAARVQAQVRNAVDAGAAYADAQVSIAQRQLDALDALGQKLDLINSSVLSFADALARYQMVAGQVPMDPQWGNVANIDVNKALAAATGYQGAFGKGGFQAFVTAASPDIQAKARAILTAYNETGRIVGFATGGSITPGGPTSGDRVPVTWMMNGGETAYVSRQDVMQGVLSELRSLRAEVASQRAANAKTARATDQMSVILRRVTQDGNSLVTTAA